MFIHKNRIGLSNLSSVLGLGVLFFVMSITSSCVYESFSPIPSYPVYCEIDFSSSKGKDLLPQGGYVRILNREVERSAIGFGGLLVIHSLGDNGAYYAYDLACPKERDAEILLVVNKAYEAECPKCKSRFSIQFGDGSPIAPPADKPLRTYQVTHTGRGLLIRNNRR